MVDSYLKQKKLSRKKFDQRMKVLEMFTQAPNYTITNTTLKKIDSNFEFFEKQIHYQ